VNGRFKEDMSLGCMTVYRLAQDGHFPYNTNQTFFLARHIRF
jgi:hypothetical protein